MAVLMLGEPLPETNGSILAIDLPKGERPFVYLEREKAAIAATLDAHGALVLRGFSADSPAQFAELTKTLSPNQPSFTEESSPRSRIEGAVFTSTDYPPAYPIQFHNEYSYASEWPGRLYFGCIVAPSDRGATPIADTRRILARLRESTREQFRAKGVSYLRNYFPKMGVSWQVAFSTDERAQVEAHCAGVGIRTEWRASGVLTTRQTADAIVTHPRTGEEVWFNHGFFFNVEGIEPEEVRETLLMEPEEDLSTNTAYGDGSPIESDVFEELRAAYDGERRRFAWHTGDVLVIDNMLMSHAREPYSGPRKIVVTMSDPIRRADLRHASVR